MRVVNGKQGYNCYMEGGAGWGVREVLNCTFFLVKHALVKMCVTHPTSQNAPEVDKEIGNNV